MPVIPSSPYLDPTRPAAERAGDLVGRLTLDEKLAQLRHDAPAVERVGLPAHNYWNECLHGVARAGVATVFPQAIALAASWDVELVGAVAQAISDEARAKHHQAAREGRSGQYTGLTCWSPTLNLFRDPRWGRGQETYGEDPHLAARLGVAFVRGLQGDDSRYLKVVATPKHFAVHSGPEAERHRFDVRVSERDLRQSYLPQFEAAVREAGAASIMTAYTRLNGEPCSSSSRLIGSILRDEWGFRGYVVSDCGAIDDIYQGHQVVATAPEAAARAIRAGCDLECGGIYRRLPEALAAGLITLEEIDRSLARVLEARIRLGVLDPAERVPHARIPASVVSCAEHRELAIEAARRGTVLLANGRGLLPLGAWCQRLAVIGPGAESLEVLLGNYFGTPASPITLGAGLRDGAPSGTSVSIAEGCTHAGGATAGIAGAVRCARDADACVLLLGLSPLFEGEEGDAILAGALGDRAGLGLPGVQADLLRAVLDTGKPVVVVLTGGSPVAVPFLEEIGALLLTWYPGEAGGAALADLLWGRASPTGRLPITLYASADELPPFEDYGMRGRTYRSFGGRVLYPFGHGLAYSRFRYRGLQISSPSAVTVELESLGQRTAEEVVQLYLSREEPSPTDDRRIWLAGFARVRFSPGEIATVTFSLGPRELGHHAEDGSFVVEPGPLRVAVGGCQPGAAGYPSDEQGLCGRLLVPDGAVVPSSGEK